MSERVTLRDVAQYAGVSITTVSNVVRGWPYVASSTRTRVQQAIHELGYAPNPIAQSLRTGQVSSIGFIVPDLSNPYFASIVSVAENVAQEHGYNLIVFNTGEDENREVACLQRATNHLVDGLLIAHVVGSRTSELLPSLRVPVVSIDRVPTGYDGPSCVLDNIQAAQLATRHLCELGHRYVAHIAGPIGTEPARARMQGYMETMHEHGLNYCRVTYCDESWGCESGYRAMLELLSEDVSPTAVFASNDRVAIGALHAIQDCGRRVPGDISVVGVDDIEVSAHIQPRLTTVRQPLEDMASAGIQLLLNLMRGETPRNTHVVLEPSLVVRDSTTAFG